MGHFATLCNILKQRTKYRLYGELSKALVRGYYRATRDGIKDEISRAQIWASKGAHTARKALEEIQVNAEKQRNETDDDSGGETATSDGAVSGGEGRGVSCGPENGAGAGVTLQ